MKKPASGASKKNSAGAGKKTGKKASAATGKKAAVAGQKTAAPGKSKRGELLKRLNAVVQNLDESGIGFLLQQAEVMQHNMKVTKLNEEHREFISEKKSKKPAPAYDKKTIEVIEADDLRHFILVINNARSFFSRDEMRKLAAICQGAFDAVEGSRNLYGWFSRFRKDVLIDVGIDSPSDTALGVMYRAIIERYVPK